MQRAKIFKLLIQYIRIRENGIQKNEYGWSLSSPSRTTNLLNGVMSAKAWVQIVRGPASHPLRD